MLNGGPLVADEALIYLLTVLLGVSVGLSFASTTAGAFRWLGRVAGLLVLSVVVIAGFIIGARAVWIGPIFVLVLFITTVMVGALIPRDDPVFLAQSYWRRVLLVSRGYKSAPTRSAEGSDLHPPRRGSEER